MRKEIDELTFKFETVENHNAQLEVQNNSLTAKLEKTETDLVQTSESLTLSNKVKTTIEGQLKDLQKSYGDLSNAYNEKERLLIQFKTKFEAEQVKSLEAERNLQTAETQKRALEKQYEIQRQQMTDKFTQFKT